MNKVWNRVLSRGLRFAGGGICFVLQKGRRISLRQNGLYGLRLDEAWRARSAIFGSRIEVIGKAGAGRCFRTLVAVRADVVNDRRRGSNENCERSYRDEEQEMHLQQDNKRRSVVHFIRRGEKGGRR